MNTRHVLCAGAALSYVVLSGCATNSVVTTTKVDDKLTSQALAERTAYLPYFLPQSVFVVTMKKAGGAGGDDKKETPPVNVSNTITIQGGTATAKKDPPAKANAAEAKKPVCDMLKESYNKQRDEQGAFAAQWGERRAALLTISQGELKKPKEKVAARKAYDALKGDIEKANLRVADAEKLGKSIAEACPEKISIDVSMEVIPDTDASYMLLLEDRAVSSDKLAAKTDDHGLLTSISTTADDKTGETIVAGLKSLGTVIGAASPLDLNGFGGLSITPPPALPSAAAALVDGNDTFADDFRKAVRKLLEDSKEVPGLLPELGLKLPQHPLRFTLRELLSDRNLTGKATLAATSYRLDLACSGLPGSLTPDDPDPTPRNGQTARRAASQGAFMATPRSCEVVVDKVDAKAVAAAGSVERQRFFVTVVDSRAPLQAPLLRSRFVARSNSYEFKDGRLTSVTYDKPSTAAAAVALPGAAVGAIFGGLVTGIQGPQGATKAQADYLDAQAAVYKSKAALIEAQVKAKKAEDDAKNPKPDDDKADDSAT